MTKALRCFLQILFWLFIWFVICWNQPNPMRFVSNNWVVIFFQAISILLIAYLLFPRLFIEKKTKLFVICCISFILITTFISAALWKQPPLIGPMGMGPQVQPPAPILINGFSITIAVVVVTIIELLTYTKRREELLLLSRNENLQNELKLLKSQINPHFLFNSLNNIYSLSTIDPIKTQSSIAHLSDMLRYVIYDCEQDQVPLEKEIKYIEDYIELYREKSSKNFNIILETDLTQTSIEIAPMILIPFIENAFKHGDIEKNQDGSILIKVNSYVNTVELIVENSYSNTLKINDKNSGIGIENVRKRLNLLYPDKHILEIKNQSNWYTVKLELATND